MLKMTIGPSRFAASVLQCASVPPPAITDPGFLKTFAQCLADLRTVLGSANGQTFIIPGTGTMGLEMVPSSFLRPGTPVAIISTGYWGQRWITICRRLGLEVHEIACFANRPPDRDAISRILRTKGCGALFATHADSSSGLLLDLKSCGELAKSCNALFIVDGICAAGIEAVEQSAWMVDIYITSTPKGLGVPAGIVLISSNRQATETLRSRSWEPSTLALDLQPWIGVMEAAEEGKFGYFQSPAGNLVLGLAEGLRLVLAEGIQTRVQRHQELTLRLHQGLEGLGIRRLVEDPAISSNGVTVCYYPHSMGSSFLEKTAHEGVLIVGGLFPGLESQTFRIGHLGNVTSEDIVQTLGAMKRALGSVVPEAVAPQTSVAS